ncbi:MAG: hypothetical protein NVSMB27_38770 [Ktedonobacteraceae bacterium]
MQAGPNPFNRIELERRRREGQELERQPPEQQLVGVPLPGITSLLALLP